MTNIPSNLRYTRQHEWAELRDGKLYIGITDYAQHSLGDIVFVELPDSGTSLAAEDSFGSIESVKAAEDLYAPVAGEIAETNEEIRDNPEKINSDPYGSWLVAISGVDSTAIDALLDAAAYQAFIDSIEG